MRKIKYRIVQFLNGNYGLEVYKKSFNILWFKIPDKVIGYMSIGGNMYPIENISNIRQYCNYKTIEDIYVYHSPLFPTKVIKNL